MLRWYVIDFHFFGLWKSHGNSCHLTECILVCRSHLKWLIRRRHVSFDWVYTCAWVSPQVTDTQPTSVIWLSVSVWTGLTWSDWYTADMCHLTECIRARGSHLKWHTQPTCHLNECILVCRSHLKWLIHSRHVSSDWAYPCARVSLEVTYAADMCHLTECILVRSFTWSDWYAAYICHLTERIRVRGSHLKWLIHSRRLSSDWVYPCTRVSLEVTYTADVSSDWAYPCARVSPEVTDTQSRCVVWLSVSLCAGLTWSDWYAADITVHDRVSEDHR